MRNRSATTGSLSEPGIDREDGKSNVPFVRDRWAQQTQSLGRIVLVVYLPAILLLSLALLQNQVPVTDLFRDLDAVEGVPFYSGFYSQLGIVFWACTAAVSLFTWAVLRRIHDSADWQLFFLTAGAFTGLLLVDDLFLLHEEVLPRLSRFGEVGIYLLYPAGALAFLVRFRHLLGGTNYLALILALAFLGLSVFVDEGTELLVGQETANFTRYRIVVEDGAKFLGILGWLAYFAGTAAQRFSRLFLTRSATSQNRGRITVL